MAEGDVQKGWQTEVLTFLAMALWLGGFHLNVLVGGLCLWNFRSPWALTLLAFWIALIFVPVRPEGSVGQSVARFICKYVPAYFPIRVVFEDESAFNVKQSYGEPHSLLPIGIVVLTPQCGILPISKLKALATSAIFWTPIVRHVWSWLGVAPVSRKYLTGLLDRGWSAIIIPGGVQECLYMERGREVVYLKKRYGFVKVAFETGAHIVPTFCFGQEFRGVINGGNPQGSGTINYLEQLASRLLCFGGRYGTPIPFRTPMTYVIGKPIEIVKNPQATREEVAAVLEKYVEAVEVLFETHKAAAGCKDIMLHVY